MTFTADVRATVQCAGNSCVDREKCLRYLKRSSHNAWASFDVERARFPEPCVHRLWFLKKAAA